MIRYWKGDKARYTGKVSEAHGATWYELELLEGHRKGEIVVVLESPHQFSNGERVDAT